MGKMKEKMLNGMLEYQQAQFNQLFGALDAINPKTVDYSDYIENADHMDQARSDIFGSMVSMVANGCLNDHPVQIADKLCEVIGFKGDQRDILINAAEKSANIEG